MTDIPALILAGGLSRRMGGGDKALLDLGGKPILAHVIERITKQASAVILNANGPCDRFSAYGLPVIADSIEGFAGPLAGVLAGLDWAVQNGASQIVTVAADTPFFPADLVEQLVTTAEAEGTDLALAATSDPTTGISRHPVFGLWPVRLREDLRRALNDGTRRVLQWADGRGAANALFPMGAVDPFFNVNTPEDLALANRLLAEELA